MGGGVGGRRGESREEIGKAIQTKGLKYGWNEPLVVFRLFPDGDREKSRRQPHKGKPSSRAPLKDLKVKKVRA